jgi:uncharacterized Zn finger protein
VDAECDCPAYDTYYTYCKHIAAVLLQINEDDEEDNNPREAAFSNKDLQLTNNILSLLDSTAVYPEAEPSEENKQLVDVEFICNANSLPSGKNMFTIEQIAIRVRPFILRRMKTDVLKELPEKIETIQSPDLSKEQKTLYAAYLSKLQQETIEDFKRMASRRA